MPTLIQLLMSLNTGGKYLPVTGFLHSKAQRRRNGRMRRALGVSYREKIGGIKCRRGEVGEL